MSLALIIHKMESILFTSAKIRENANTTKFFRPAKRYNRRKEIFNNTRIIEKYYFLYYFTYLCAPLTSFTFENPNN